MSTSAIITPDQHTGVLLTIDEQYHNLPPTELYNMVSSRLGALGFTEEQAEGFWSTLGDIGKAAVGVVQKAAPGIISGATTGSALGPWGALAGGLVGGATSLLSSGQQPRRPAIPQIPAAAAGGVASPSAQLLQLIQNPAVSQALTSLTMGALGRKTIPVGGRSIPTGDLLNLLSSLTASASKEAAEAYATPVEDAFILESDEGFDPANPEQRAQALMGLLNRQEQLQRLTESGDESIDNLFTKDGSFSVNLQ